MARATRVGREALVVEVELGEAALDQALGVVGVVDREGRLVAQPLGLAAQDAGAHRVEGRDPHDARHRADEGADAAAHLAGGLVGEGDGEDLVGAHAAHADEVGDAVGEHARLARAGAGQDEQRALEVGHGLALRLVQAARSSSAAAERRPRARVRRRRRVARLVGALIAGPSRAARSGPGTARRPRRASCPTRSGAGATRGPGRDRARRARRRRSITPIT